MALTTTAFVQTSMGLQGLNATDLAQLDTLRQAAETIVSTRVGRRLDKLRAVEYYAGNGKVALILRRTPVWAVHSLRADATGYFGVPVGAFDSSTALVEGEDFAIDEDQPVDAAGYRSRSGILFRIKNVWRERDLVYTPGLVTMGAAGPFGNIKVDYTAGYDPAPMDLQIAVVLLTALLRRTVPTGQMLLSERIGDYSYEIMSGRMMQANHPVFGSVEQILARYREVPL